MMHVIKTVILLCNNLQYKMNVFYLMEIESCHLRLRKNDVVTNFEYIAALAVLVNVEFDEKLARVLQNSFGRD